MFSISRKKHFYSSNLCRLWCQKDFFARPFIFSLCKCNIKGLIVQVWSVRQISISHITLNGIAKRIGSIRRLEILAERNLEWWSRGNTTRPSFHAAGAGESTRICTKIVWNSMLHPRGLVSRSDLGLSWIHRHRLQHAKGQMNCTEVNDGKWRKRNWKWRNEKKMNKNWGNGSRSYSICSNKNLNMW